MFWKQDGGGAPVVAPSRPGNGAHGAPNVPLHEQYRVTLPRPASFMGVPAGRWTWDSWARRAEHQWLMVGRGIEAAVWGLVGALAGAACAAAPSAFLNGYPYVLWGPVGAAAGTLLGVAWTWRRWQAILRLHESLLR